MLKPCKYELHVRLTCQPGCKAGWFAAGHC